MEIFNLNKESQKLNSKWNREWVYHVKNVLQHSFGGISSKDDIKLINTNIKNPYNIFATFNSNGVRYILHVHEPNNESIFATIGRHDQYREGSDIFNPLFDTILVQEPYDIVSLVTDFIEKGNDDDDFGDEDDPDFNPDIDSYEKRKQFLNANNEYFNLLKLSQRKYKGRGRKPYYGVPRYFGSPKLVSYNGKYIIIGNTMKIKNQLKDMGFQWDGNISIDASDIPDAQHGVINGAQILNSELTPEIEMQLESMGVDMSKKDIQHKDYVPVKEEESNVNLIDLNKKENKIEFKEEEMSYLNENEKEELIRKLEEAKGAKANAEVIDEYIQKFQNIINNPELQEKQKKMAEDLMKFQSKHHKYSFNNVILIWMQNPNAQMVGGEKTFWNKVGRRIKQEEISKPIVILRPNIYKRKLDERTINMVRRRNEDSARAEKEIENLSKRVYFAPAPVYDISQTEFIPGWRHPQTGEPPFDLESYHESYLNKFNSPDAYYDSLFYATLDYAQSMGITTVENRMGYEGGASHIGKISLAPGSKGLRRLQVYLHEMAHEIIHDEEYRKNLKNRNKLVEESEAESVSYIVCNIFGISSDEESSARYLLLWNAPPEIIRERQKNIQKAVQQIVSGIQEFLDKQININKIPKSSESLSYFKLL